AVALRHEARERVDDRLVVRVRGHDDELAQPARRQLGVAVERDDVARAGLDARGRAEVDEGGRARIGHTRFGDSRDQLLELAALALPAYPALLGFAEHALAVQ